jgi:hypothetical protein
MCLTNKEVYREYIRHIFYSVFALLFVDVHSEDMHILTMMKGISKTIYSYYIAMIHFHLTCCPMLLQDKGNVMVPLSRKHSICPPRFASKLNRILRLEEMRSLSRHGVIYSRCQGKPYNIETTDTLNIHHILHGSDGFCLAGGTAGEKRTLIRLSIAPTETSWGLATTTIRRPG